MSVSYTTILRKLSEQIVLAEQAKKDPQLLKQHISQAKLLCELMLDEQTTKTPKKNIEFMKGQVNQQENLNVDQSAVAEDLPGDSIFDF